MNTIRSTVVLCVLAALAGVAGAQTQPKTRAEVQAELAAAQAHGDLLLSSGLRDRDLAPGMYPADPPRAAGKSRAEVEAELAAAQAHGDLLLSSGLRERDLAPGMYPPNAPMVAGKTRMQVEAELAQAIRNGDMLAPGEIGLPEKVVDPTFYARHEGPATTQFVQGADPAAGALQ